MMLTIHAMIQVTILVIHAMIQVMILMIQVIMIVIMIYMHDHGTLMILMIHNIILYYFMCCGIVLNIKKHAQDRGSCFHQLMSYI